MATISRNNLAYDIARMPEDVSLFTDEEPVREVSEEKKVEPFHTTYDYDMFRLLPEYNRKVRPALVRKVKEWLLELGEQEEPIRVTRDHILLDGQHRLTALRELRWPVKYVYSSLKPWNIEALNQARSNWTLNDYLDTKALRGEGDYPELKRIRQQNPKIGLKALLEILSGASSGSDSIKNFKKGSFRIADLEKASKIISWLNDLVNYNPKVCSTLVFQLSFNRFIRKVEDYDHERMMDNLDMNFSLLKKSSDWDQTLHMIQTAYNYYERKKKSVIQQPK